MAGFSVSDAGYSQVRQAQMYAQWNELNNRIKPNQQGIDPPTIPSVSEIQHQPEESEHEPEIDAKTQQMLAADTLWMFLAHDADCAARLFSQNQTTYTRQNVSRNRDYAERSSPQNQTTDTDTKQNVFRSISSNNNEPDITRQNPWEEGFVPQWTLDANKNRFMPNAIRV